MMRHHQDLRMSCFYHLPLQYKTLISIKIEITTLLRHHE